MPFRRAALWLVPVLTILAVGGAAFVAEPKARDPQPDARWLELNRKVREQSERFPGVSGIVIKDLRRGWTIEHNPSRLFPSASLVKLPLMVALYEADLRGEISLDQSFPILRHLRARGSGTLKFQRPGTRLTIHEFISRMITESDNTATNVLTNLFGLDYYNSQFLSMGLSRTNFSRTIMDLRQRDRGIENYTTPRDMARLLEWIYRGRFSGSREMMDILKAQKINDRLARGIPGDWTIGHKTGLMRDSCHDVGIVFAPGSDYVICALTTDARSSRRAKKFITSLSKLTAEYYLSGPAREAAALPRRAFWPRLFHRDATGQG